MDLGAGKDEFKEKSADGTIWEEFVIRIEFRMK